MSRRRKQEKLYTAAVDLAETKRIRAELLLSIQEEWQKYLRLQADVARAEQRLQEETAERDRRLRTASPETVRKYWLLEKKVRENDRQ